MICRRFRITVTIKTKQGIFSLPLDTDDPIYRSLFLTREYELDLIIDAMCLIRKLRGLPKGRGTVLDIGANNGVISIGMLVNGELEKAIAIEPDPKNFSILKHNIMQNNLEDVITCINYAVSDNKSILQFELSKNNFGDHRVRKLLPDIKLKELYYESQRRVINVKANTLDNLIADLDKKFSKDISVI